MELISLVFRIPAILIGVAMGFFAFGLSRYSKGGSEGWLYLSIAGMSLGLWAITAVAFTFLDLPLFRMLSGIVFLMGMALFFPLGYGRLVSDFRLSKSKMFSVPVLMSVVVAVFVGLMLMQGPGLSLAHLLSVSHLTLGIAALVGAIPSFVLMRRTGLSPWRFSFLFMLIAGLSLNIGQYYDGCCTTAMASDPVCESYSLDYVAVYDAPCITSLVAAGSYYQVFLLIGIALGTFSVYQLWSRFRKVVL